MGKENMYIYLLEILDTFDDYPEYDIFGGHVIIAKNEIEARAFCNYSDEGDIWKDNNKTSCVLIGSAYSEKKDIILSDYRAG